MKLVDSETIPTFDIDIKVLSPEPSGQPHRFNAKGQIDKRFSFKDITHGFHYQPQIGREVVSGKSRKDI